MDYYLNIGSNMGDRRDNLYRAVVALAAGTSGCAVSRIVESEPWGYDSDNRFLNLGLKLSSGIDPHEMLERIHDIERRLGSASHRDDEGRYIDRLVDIDIMAIDDMVIEGKIKRGSKVRVIRDGIVIQTGELASLKRFKDDVKEVSSGFDCGFSLKSYNDLQEMDIVEAFEEIEVHKTL